MKEMERYLKATAVIDCDNALVIEKARSLTRGQEKEIDKAKTLFYFVRDDIRYNLWVLSDHPEHFIASRTLARGDGFCVQKAVLLAALARVVGIPSRIHIAGICNHLIPDKVKELVKSNYFPTHGYDELYIEGKWVKATPAFDLTMCQKNGLVPVEFDGKHDAILPSHNQEGKPHIEYVRDHGHFDDLPFERIAELRSEAIGPDWAEHLRKTIFAMNAKRQNVG